MQYTHTTLTGKTLEFLLSGSKTNSQIRDQLRGSGRSPTDAKVASVLFTLREDSLIHFFLDNSEPGFTYGLSTNGTVLANLIRLERLAFTHANGYMISQIAKARKQTVAVLRNPIC